jgi:hypothetical protein
VALVAGGFGWALGAGFMAALGFQSGFLTFIVALVAALVLLVLGRVSIEALRTTGNSIGPVLQDSWFWLVVWLIIAIAGIVVQIRANRSYTHSREQQVQDWG